MNNVNGKKVISRILEEKREWNSVNKKLPDPNQRVVIRMGHKTLLFYEDETKIYPAEDMKIGRCIRDDKKGIRWVVDGPYPKFDYSPLSYKADIANDVVVTHWAIPEDGELDAWDHRFDIHMPYKNLHISVDPENEELVYRAIMWGASFLGKSMADGEDNPEEIHALWVTLCDLQSCFDQGIEIKDGQIIKLNNNRDSNEKPSTDDMINEMKNLALSSENICKCIGEMMDKIMKTTEGHTYKNDIDSYISHLWCLHDMLIHEFRKRSIVDTVGVDMNKLPSMFFQKLGERLYRSIPEDERKRLTDSYIAKYITPYEKKESSPDNKEE